ncbi:MAG: Biopolymer transport protein ExbD/TolR [bacterium]|nr:Biopolymer transport protein ExbD/TolR [bacterium]
MAGGMDSFGRPSQPRRRRAKIHKKRAGSISPGATKNEINVTPLVDVVLVLLIIFMVVTPMLHRGVHVELPTTEHHQKKQDTGEQLVVTIRGDGAVFIETDKIPDEQLVERVKKELKAQRPVHVRADKNLHYDVVRKVLEKVHDAGAQNVAMGTEDQK